ncbi:50S ribosomal protein L29 [uncultured Tessaracoccus sp.]|uniref:50S ribosomal protein L29 n=1 Tax=uncultured Tessaracoccus sp. TaxID=905023 RepID=UPI0025E6FCE9|nr:50S ribosomal protein L29 [uncultured Tessaracoccus sp.]
MSKALKAADLRGMTREALYEKVNELQQERFGLRFQAASGQLESHGRLREVRKDLARVYTVLQERNLGMIEEPVEEK